MTRLLRRTLLTQSITGGDEYLSLLFRSYAPECFAFHVVDKTTKL